MHFKNGWLNAMVKVTYTQEKLVLFQTSFLQDFSIFRWEDSQEITTYICHVLRAIPVKVYSTQGW